MNGGNGLQRTFNRNVSPGAISGQAVSPARGLIGCACGAPGGQCTCANGNASPSRFVYVLGTVDIRFPDQSISEELQSVGRNLKQGPKEDLRSWCYRVLKQDEARYVARQLCWILTVEGLPAYYLALRDLYDLKDLIECLGRPRGQDLNLFVGSSSLIPVEACPESQRRFFLWIICARSTRIS